MRRKDREITRIEDILSIVDRAKVLRLGLFDDNFPYIVPLHFGYEYAEGKLIFYMHSAKEGHKLDLIKRNQNVCIELDCDTELISGGDIPCSYSSSFASLIGRGLAEIVDDEQEKVRGLYLLMKNQTGREFEITPQMASAVAVIKVVVCDFSAKSKPKA
ncbi:MAG: pyridoxamine 5'-phosphate oxidase family protein [Ruminococcus sp.]|nr:pyridoxamine 5'-phosphate oxidase family protein [Ruminococcus sp.]